MPPLVSPQRQHDLWQYMENISLVGHYLLLQMLWSTHNQIKECRNQATYSVNQVDGRERDAKREPCDADSPKSNMRQHDIFVQVHSRQKYYEHCLTWLLLTYIKWQQSIHHGPVWSVQKRHQLWANAEQVCTRNGSSLPENVETAHSQWTNLAKEAHLG